MTRDLNKFKIEDFYFQHKIKTRFRDLDSFNHINNATFLSYLEDARILFFKRWNVNKTNKSLIVASIKIDYIEQVTHPSELIICQRISRIGNKSFDNKSLIFCQEKVVCSSTTTIVCYDFISKKTVPVYSEIKNDLDL
tara:strand:- start:505 stop:918 length:414 start_codon:yes stop_codon:yes gene_type:complete